MFVNVLLEMLWLKRVPALVMKVIAPVASYRMAEGIKVVVVDVERRGRCWPYCCDVDAVDRPGSHAAPQR